MAFATTVKGGQGLVLLLGAGSAPVVYTAPCGMTEKSLRLITNAGEQMVPDCTNPDLPSLITRYIESTDMQGSGQGVMARESVETWIARQGVIGPARVDLVLPAATPLTSKTLSWTGNIIVTEIEMAAISKQDVTMNITWAAAGVMTFAAV